MRKPDTFACTLSSIYRSTMFFFFVVTFTLAVSIQPNYKSKKKTVSQIVNMRNQRMPVHSSVICFSGTYILSRQYKDSLCFVWNRRGIIYSIAMSWKYRCVLFICIAIDYKRKGGIFHKLLFNIGRMWTVSRRSAIIIVARICQRDQISRRSEHVLVVNKKNIVFHAGISYLTLNIYKLVYNTSNLKFFLPFFYRTFHFKLERVNNLFQKKVNHNKSHFYWHQSLILFPMVIYLLPYEVIDNII